MKAFSSLVVLLGVATFLHYPRESSGLRRDSLDQLIDSVVKSINKVKRTQELSTSEKASEEHIKEISKDETKDKGDNDDVSQKRDLLKEKITKILNEKKEAKEKADNNDDVKKESVADAKRSKVISLKPITLKICSQTMFQTFMRHLCPLKLKRRRQKRDVMIPRQQAMKFLKNSHHLTKRSVDLSNIGDIFFMDECCSNKGCNLNEINEYCV